MRAPVPSYATSSYRTTRYPPPRAPSGLEEGSSSFCCASTRNHVSACSVAFHCMETMARSVLGVDVHVRPNANGWS